MKTRLRQRLKRSRRISRFKMQLSLLTQKENNLRLRKEFRLIKPSRKSNIRLNKPIKKSSVLLNKRIKKSNILRSIKSKRTPNIHRKKSKEIQIKTTNNVGMKAINLVNTEILILNLMVLLKVKVY